MRFIPLFSVSLVSLFLLTPFQNAFASTLKEEPRVEWEQRQNPDERLRAYGPDLLGDQIDPHMGSISFEHTDVAIPGNNGLEVALRRRISQGYLYDEGVNAEFGDWEYVVPRIVVISPPAGWTGARCSSSFDSSLAPIPASKLKQLYNRDYSQGVTMDVPGAGSQQILESPTGAQWPSGKTHVTSQGWYFTCISDIGSGNGGGEGFIAHAPNGDTYRFDRYFTHAFTNMGSLAKGKQQGQARVKSILAATEVTDVNGNWVHYNYDSSGRLDSITSSDGRTIDLVYTGSSKLVSQVKANPSGDLRTWAYSYRASNFQLPFYDGGGYLNSQVLSSVTLPDGRSWTFNLDEMSAEPGPGLCQMPGGSLSLTHPYGVTGTFVLSEKRHRQGLNTMMPEVLQCPDPEPSYGTAPPNYVFALVDTMSVTSKNLTGPGIASSTWTFAYEYDQGPAGSSSGDPTNWTTVTEPGGTQIKYYHYWQEGDFGGKLAKKEMRQTSASSPLETMDQTYLAEGTVGNTFAAVGPVSGSIRARINPVRTTITRTSGVYNTKNAYNTNFSSSSYSFGFPTKVEEWGNTAGGLGNERVADIVYAHNKTKWVLGLQSTVTRNSKLFDAYTYDTNGRVLTESRFGNLMRTLTYNADGTIATAKDSHNHTYTLSNWKRGRPQTVLRPDSNTFSRVIDDNGWVTSETDANGNTLGFTYNGVGWLTGVDRPAPFNDTTVAYTGLGTTSAKETRTRGARKITITYDSMLRPTLVKTEATDASASTVYEKTDYDIFGRATFQSWPSASSSPTAGVDTTYDALSRVLTVAETVTPYATTTTEYLSDGQTRVTDPSNAQVTTTARAFGGPDQNPEVMQVIDAMGATTAMTRDIYGNITQLSQSGTQNGFTASVTRNFWYDNELRLCRHRAPEFGDEVFLYDDEGQLTQSGRGAAVASGCVTSIPTSIRVTHTYDSLHRETYIDFPQGTPDIARTYDNNGNVLTATRTGGAVWTYLYNALDLLTREKLIIGSKTLQFDYGYNNNGDVISRQSPSGVTFDFAPDAFGRPTKVARGTTNHITNVTYHPNGAVASMTLGSDQVVTQSINARQLISEIKSQKPGGLLAEHFNYLYDARGLITSITDTAVSGHDRSFTYDANGRLLTASGWWGTGTFTYDALGNLREKTHGSRTVTMGYSASQNRVSTVDDSASPGTRTYSYDARGNVLYDGFNSFVYDDANQPESATNSSFASSYEYDANLKRVKAVTSADTSYYFYSALTGTMIYRDKSGGSNVDGDVIKLGPVEFRFFNGWGEGSFIHLDSLGSSVAMTNGATGALGWREHYSPFGEQELDASGTNGYSGFTGHVEDFDTGLTYMQARYYDPVIGRFLSTDPIGYQDQLNLYAYVGNDPVNKIDPTGENSEAGHDRLAAAARTNPRGVAIVGGIGLAGGATIMAWPAAAAAAPELTAATEFAAGFVPGMETYAGVGAGAAFAQKTFSETFSAGGQKFFQDTLGVAVKTIDDLASAIKGGAVNASDVPVQTIMREGTELMLNTRSAQALERAGVARSEFNAVDMTGDAAAEARLSGQLDRNELTSAGCANPTSTGC